MRRGAVILTTTMILALLPATAAMAAEPQSRIDFNGSGWGHGVGLSQYGAYGRALEGSSASQIITAYYPGASVGTLGQGGLNPVDEIVTNVQADIQTTTLTVIDGPTSPRPGLVVTWHDPAAVPTDRLLRSGDTVTITDQTYEHGAPGGCLVTTTVDGVTTEWGQGSCDLTVALNPGGGEPANLVSATNCRRPTQCTYGYGTSFKVVDNASPQRSRADRYPTIGCSTCPEWRGFDLVVSTTPDEYVRGISEMPFSWGINAQQALRAQAIAARSYAASFAASTDHTAMGCFCDVRNDSSYQVYAGWIKGWGPTSYWNLWDDAATSTNGKVVQHAAAPDGNGIVRAYFSSSNGGATEWVKEKWGSNLPYLTSVADPWSLKPSVGNPYASWKRTFTADAVVDKIWGTSSTYTLIGADVTARNVSGSAKTIRFDARTANDSTVSKNVSVGTVASAFGLPSWYFDIDDTLLIVPPPSHADGVGLQDPRTGVWSLRDPDGSVRQFYFGDPNDIPFIGDWNGDGVETVGLYRKSVGFLFLRYTNTQGVADVDIYYGIPGDVPIAGDWNGDGIDTVGIYRPSEGHFYLRNTNTQGVADIDFAFGNPGDVPVAGDWNGDGIDTVGVYRPSTRMVYLTDSLSTRSVSVSFAYEGTVSGDRVIAGDWDDDGDDTLGVFRPSTGMFYLRDTFTQTSANVAFSFGDSWMNPIAGFWGG
jgi:SpoIID/LytB domain protein